MTRICVLHVDDKPDIREVVSFYLRLDPSFMVRSCGSGTEALTAAVRWQPDLILLDVIMPVMDGPATLVQLRANARTANISVILTTACTQAREVDHFRSLGAVGVLAKPFDPLTLAASVRSYMPAARDPLDDLRTRFLLRVKTDAEALRQDRRLLKGENRTQDTLDRIKRIAHALSGAGGIFGFPRISDAAAALEDAAIAELANTATGDETDVALNGLLLQCGELR